MTPRLQQKPKLEVRFAVLEQRVNDLVERHETVPGRVTRLEGEFEHIGAQLAALNDGQRELTGGGAPRGFWCANPNLAQL